MVRGLDGDAADGQARYVEGTVGTVRVASIYLPNGNPVGTGKFAYKLSWMARLRDRVKALLEEEETCVLGGDYNVCPADADVYDPPAFADDALCRPETRTLFRSIVYLGLTDAVRAFHPGPGRLFLLGLPAGRLDQGPRAAHRPPAADPAGGRPPRGRRRRPPSARRGETFGPHAGVVRDRGVTDMDVARRRRAEVKVEAAPLRRTVLHGWHAEAGARMVAFGGWDMPVQYPAGTVREHLATRRAAGLFDVSHMGRFRIGGAGAEAFLAHALTNDARALDPGQAQYTFIANEAGGAVDDAYLYRLARDDFLLVVNAANRDKDRDVAGEPRLRGRSRSPTRARPSA